MHSRLVIKWVKKNKETFNNNNDKPIDVSLVFKRIEE